MPLINTDINVDVDVDLGNFALKDLIIEVENRGYIVEHAEGYMEVLDNEDLSFVLSMLDTIPENWFTKRLRDKFLFLRYER